MATSKRRAELKAFLRARRAAISPAAVSLAPGSRRQTVGLRREELAALAGVGLTWYTWLEQGREISVSSEVLRRVSRALRLSASDEAYIFALAGVAPDRKRRTSGAVTPGMREAIERFSAGPAMVFGPVFDVLAYNRLGDLIYSFSGSSGRFAGNHLWRLFMDPVRQRLYPSAHIERGARNVVGIFRARYAEHVGEPRFEELIAELLSGSPLFQKLWNERTTNPLTTFVAPIEHPLLGALEFYSVRLTPGDAPEDTVYLFPPANERTERAMEKARRLLRKPSKSKRALRG